MMAMSTLSPAPPGFSRWRSVLTTKKWSPRGGGDKKQINLLPTVMAAATEKVVVRHRRPSQYVQSEDLTAMQFASMAGIKIKESTDDDTDSVLGTIRDELNKTTTQISMTRSSSNRSNGYYTRKCQQPQIWDSAFWHRQQHDDDDDNNNKTSPVNKLAAASSTPTLSTAPSYASRTSTCSEQSVSTLHPPSLVRSSGPSVIHKGRFKIVLGQDDDDLKPAEPQYVEWRRKRACTN